MTSLVAEPIKVDVDSLKKEGPVRVRVNCRDPAKQHTGYVEVFFNSVGYELKFFAEGSHGNSQDGGHGDPPGDKNGNQDRRREKDEGDAPNRLDKNSSNTGRRDRTLEKELDNSQEDSLEEDSEDLIRDGSPGESEEQSNKVIPIAAYHPTLDMTMGENELQIASQLQLVEEEFQGQGQGSYRGG